MDLGSGHGSRRDRIGDKNQVGTETADLETKEIIPHIPSLKIFEIHSPPKFSIFQTSLICRHI